VAGVVDQCLLAHPGHLEDQPVEDLLPLLVNAVADWPWVLKAGSIIEFS
jgi:hypothetical protein